MLCINSQQIARNLTTDEAVNVTQLFVHFSHTKVFEVRTIFREEHQLPLDIGASVCRGAMIIERNGNIEPELGEVDDIDIDIQAFGNSCGNVESNVFEKTVETIVSVFSPVKVSVNPLLDHGSSLFFGIVNVNLY